MVDPTASGGSAVALSGVGSVSATVTLPETTVLTVRVRSSEGAPDMTVLIDGKAVTTLLVEARSYSDYKFAGDRCRFARDQHHVFHVDNPKHALHRQGDHGGRTDRR